MIIATSGLQYINYNRIISSSITPFPVSESKTFRDPTPSQSRRLYGLYIIDQDNAVSLIYDTTSKYTDLASINFQNISISYQKAFPIIENLQIAVFTSPKVFYAGGYFKSLYTN